MPAPIVITAEMLAQIPVHPYRGRTRWPPN
jgi:hypothetical protein